MKKLYKKEFYAASLLDLPEAVMKFTPFALHVFTPM